MVLGNTASEDLVFNYNIHRVKTQAEIIYESQYYVKVFGSNQGKRTDLLSDDEKAKIENIEGDRFDKVAALMGDTLSGQTLRRIHKVIEAQEAAKEEGNTELVNLQLVEKLIGDEISAANAENLLKKYKKYSQERKEQKDEKEIKPNNLDSTYQLYNKSSEKMDEVESDSIQVVFSSPPYFQARDYENSTDEKIEIGHEKTPEEFVESLMPHFREVHRVLKNTGSFFMNFGEYGFKQYSPLVSNMLILRLHQEGLFKCINEIILFKSNMKPITCKKRLMRSYEKIYHLVKDHKNYTYKPFKIWREDEEMKIVHGFNNRGVNGTNMSKPTLQKPYKNFRDFIDLQIYEDVIKSSGANTAMYKKIDADFDHPAPYDSKICMLGLLCCSSPKDTVLDMFSGTASTGEAALMLGRNYIGYELNPSYHSFATKRLPFMTEGYNREAVENFELLKCD